MYLSISLTPYPLTGIFLKGLATAELSLGLPFQVLLCILKPLPADSFPPVHFYPINSLHWWSPAYIPLLKSCFHLQALPIVCELLVRDMPSAGGASPWVIFRKHQGGCKGDVM